jgi:hypothetical protein
MGKLGNANRLCVSESTVQPSRFMACGYCIPSAILFTYRDLLDIDRLSVKYNSDAAYDSDNLSFSILNPVWL